MMRITIPWCKNSKLRFGVLATGFSAMLSLCPLTPSACGSPQESNAEKAQESSDQATDKPKKESPAVAEFESPQMLKADGKIISVESPGYACPTMADVDGDGKPDLVVGQFRSGNMQFFKNVADSNQPPEFATGEWIMSGDERLVVPGVW